MTPHKVLVAGASGLVGSTVARYFAEQKDWDVVAVSRRRPPALDGVAFTSVDLLRRDQCEAVLGAMSDVTHVVYAVVLERPGLGSGWTGEDEELRDLNLQMLQNVIEPLAASSKALEHVTLVHGLKAYGVHLDLPMRVPMRERQPRVEHDNWYFTQQDYIERRQQGEPWSWTTWRPPLIVGAALGNQLGLVPAIGVYGALLRERGEPLHYPGNPERFEVREAVDSELLARAIAWGATASTARNEVFNVNNGDVLVWDEVWPAVAEALGMEVGEHRPMRTSEELPPFEGEWLDLAARHGLRTPADFGALVGEGFHFMDWLFGHGRAAGSHIYVSATTKLREHGFDEAFDTELMLRKWLGRLVDARVIPPAPSQIREVAG